MWTYSSRCYVLEESESETMSASLKIPGFSQFFETNTPPATAMSLSRMQIP